MENNTNKNENVKPVNHGGNMRFYRRLIEKSLDEIAERIGITVEQLAEWEDQSYLSEEILQQAAKGLRVDIEYLEVYIEPERSNIFHQNNGTNTTNFQGKEINVDNGAAAVEKAYKLKDDQIKELNDKIIQEKDRIIKALELENLTLKKSPK